MIMDPKGQENGVKENGRQAGATSPGLSPQPQFCPDRPMQVSGKQSSSCLGSTGESGGMGQPIVDIQGLIVESTVFKNRRVLDGLTLSIDRGTIVGLLGVSGSGKSTLLRCIQGLQPVTDGQVSVCGKSAFMFQDFQLFPHFTVQKNLTYAPALSSPQEQVDQQAQILMKALGIQALAQAYPQSLSGGQKQRVALARSLMVAPDILLCDEPTSGLDIATMHEVESLLRDVHARGVTMVLASHDLPFLTRVCQRVVMLKSGRIVTDVVIGEQEDPLSVLKGFF
jgi:polar amino acid transport system ATP-binding protein